MELQTLRIKLAMASSSSFVVVPDAGALCGSVCPGGRTYTSESTLACVRIRANLRLTAYVYAYACGLRFVCVCCMCVRATYGVHAMHAHVCAFIRRLVRIDRCLPVFCTYPQASGSANTNVRFFLQTLCVFLLFCPKRRIAYADVYVSIRICLVFCTYSRAAGSVDTNVRCCERLLASCYVRFLFSVRKEESRMVSFLC
jgi:hypothetical protein